MNRVALLSAVVLAIGLGAGCNKPSKDDCRKAIQNMRSLLRTQNLDTDVEGEVRRCNGGSTKEAVACAIKATSLDELRGCKFMSIPDDPPATPSPSGSGAGGSGSSAP